MQARARCRRDTLVVAADIHRPGVISAYILNAADSPAVVSVAASGAASPSEHITIAPGQNARTGHFPDDRDDESFASPAPGSIDRVPAEPVWLQIPDVPALPGLTMSLTFYINGQAVPVELVPIKLPCFEYSAMRPTAASPSSGTDRGGANAATQPVPCGPATGEVEH